ncbi:MAG TPA: hypothetical protein VFP28_07480 [Gemmatimonadales bacterium]|nr:hypothetical protein [Gemmatimonadales bacterium]
MRPADIFPSWLRSGVLARGAARTLAVAACGAAASCSYGSGVDVQTFTVSLTDTLHTSVSPDGTLVSTVLMSVDTDVGHVIGVSLNYAVTAGTLSSTTGISGINGAASVTWTVTPEQAAASGQTDLIFSACADSNEPATCTPGALASLHVGS